MRKQVADFLLSGVVFCAVRFADLALWTDLETGLVKGGHVWLRYAALFVWVLAALATGHNSAGPAALLAAPLSRKSAVALSVPAFAAGAGVTHSQPFFSASSMNRFGFSTSNARRKIRAP